MRAIVVRQFGGPEVLRLEQLPDPTPGPFDIVVRNRAAGVNPVDTYIRSGTHAVKPPLPYVPGSDGAGEVEAIGTGFIAGTDPTLMADCCCRISATSSSTVTRASGATARSFTT